MWKHSAIPMGNFSWILMTKGSIIVRWSPGDNHHFVRSQMNCEWTTRRFYFNPITSARASNSEKNSSLTTRGRDNSFAIAMSILWNVTWNCSLFVCHRHYLQIDPVYFKTQIVQHSPCDNVWVNFILKLSQHRLLQIPSLVSTTMNVSHFFFYLRFTPPSPTNPIHLTDLGWRTEENHA